MIDINDLIKYGIKLNIKRELLEVRKDIWQTIVNGNNVNNKIIRIEVSPLFDKKQENGKVFGKIYGVEVISSVCQDLLRITLVHKNRERSIIHLNNNR